MEKDISRLTEQEFDRYLEEVLDTATSGETAPSFQPWRRAMNRVLWGLGLSTMTLNFFGLNILLPAIGMVLCLIGFRALHRENRWLQLAYLLCWLRTAWWLIAFTLNITVYHEAAGAKTFLQVGSWIMLIPGYLTFAALRNGIRRIQKKCGLQPHGGNGILVWYGIALVMGLLQLQSMVAVYGMLIAYVLVLRSLWKLAGELDETGYSIVYARLRISDRMLAAGYGMAILTLLLVGYGLCNQYPMQWKPLEQTGESLTQLRQELLELGMPGYVLDDLTDAELRSCAGAKLVMVDVRDYDMDRGRGIGTQEERNEGLTYLVEPEGERQLRTTYIGIQFGQERERWKIIHHFLWLTDEDFCGTEALQLWTADRFDGWYVSGMQGRVLFDRDGDSFASEYHSLGTVSYQKDDFLSGIMGKRISSDVFATFSFPKDSRNARGYVLYDLEVLIEGGIIDSWCNYVHQHSQLQIPVQTAMEFEQTSFLTKNTAFRTVQNALQIKTHGERPKFFRE